ncbi:MAG: nidogen-like domain-containing protein [Arenicella sp.]
MDFKTKMLLTVFYCLVSMNASADAIRFGFNSNSLISNDDSSTELVSIGFDVNFFGETFSDLYINNNGNITFDQKLSTYTPFDLTTTDRKIIAPHFSDVDTRGIGSVIYGSGIIEGKNAFVVTWNGVGYFNSGTDKTNTYQLALIERSDIRIGDFDIEFNYGQIQWESGDSSGGTSGLGGSSARAGYSNGTTNAKTFFELSGSAQNGAFLDGGSKSLVANKNNESTVLGRYVFEARNGNISKENDDLLMMVVPAIAAAANNLRFDDSRVKHRNLQHVNDSFKSFRKIKTVIVNGNSKLLNIYDLLDLRTKQKFNSGKVRLFYNGSELSGKNVQIPRPSNNRHSAYKVYLRKNNSSKIEDSLLVIAIPYSTQSAYNSWTTQQRLDGNDWTLLLPKVYKTLTLLNENPEPSSGCNNWWRGASSDFHQSQNYYHPQMVYEMRSVMVNGYGHQATYDENGVLIESGVSAGSADKSHNSNRVGADSHREVDVLPFIRAAQLDGNPVNARTWLIPTNLSRPLIREGLYLRLYLDFRPELTALATDAGQCTTLQAQ